MLNLLVAPLCILLGRVEIEARAAGDIVTSENLFTRGVFRRYVFRSVLFKAVFMAPSQSCSKSLCRLVYVPSRGSKIAKDAFAGEPYTVKIGDGYRWATWR